MLLQLGNEAHFSLDKVSAVDSMRQRERFWMRFLPSVFVRRLDKGFARSNPVHPDTAQALYAICRVLKPACVFETGTYWGYSTSYLAAALRDNGGSAIVHTFDLYKRAGAHIPKNLHQYVVLHAGQAATDSMPAVLENHVPTVFLQDSVHDYEGVRAELKMVAPRMPSGSVVVLHDFISPEVQRAAADGLHGFELFRLISDDPQQLGVARKL